MTRSSDAKVTRRTVITRERLLPIPGEVLVKPGEVVRPDVIVAKAEVLPGDPYVVDLNHEFRQRLAPAEVIKAMQKRVGERVKTGETLAQLPRGVFGEILHAKSPVDGTIEFVSRAYGRLLIREDPKSALPMAVVPVAKQLDIWPSSLRMYMRFREGDEVKQGAALADSPGIAGMDYSYAPIGGIIEKIDSRTGNVTIVRPARPTMVDAYLHGTVMEVVPEYGAVVSCEAAHIQGVFGVGFENWGYLRVVARDAHAVVDAADLGDQLRDQVIVAGARITAEALRRAVSAGARGVITGGIDQLDLVDYAGQEIAVGITGQEDVSLSVIITEGFGAMPMADWTYELLREHAGRLVSLNGTTQVRAGVIRPELVIALDPHPRSSQPDAEADVSEAAGLAAGEGLLVGAVVRMLRKPSFGLWGQIVEIPADPERLETETVTRVVRVRLQDGRVVTVPRENVEVF